MKLSKLFTGFFQSEKTSGLILILCTMTSLILANSGIGESYRHFWHMDLGGHPLEFWINDALMAVFFLLIGLELEREVYIGELSTLKQAALPLFAALGGMLVPAGIYLLLNFGTPTQSGSGIPMATDIAFALGILSLLGSKVPTSLKIFLTALAVIDDLGAILIIAFFYTNNLSWANFGFAMAVFAVLLALNRLKVRNLFPYLVLGPVMWYFMLQSGIHATITGVLLAFAIPFGSGGKKSTSYILQEALHWPVSLFILPVFALANTAIVLKPDAVDAFTEPYGLGIILGLVIGKPLGISLLAYLAYRLGWGTLPEDIDWKMVASVGFLGGIGFTMSIFITLLAFDDGDHISNAKLSILVASLVAGLVGFLLLRSQLKKQAA